LDKFITEAKPEEEIPQAVLDMDAVDVSEPEIQPEFVDRSVTFTSKTEALRKIFKGKDHLLLKYESYTTKFLLENLFWNDQLEM